MSNEKILDRIRKLLAMAADANSPNEAAIAAKRARKLMDEYQVSELDLTSVGSTDMGEDNFASGQSSRSSFLMDICISIAKLNDVKAVLRKNPQGKYVYVFQGMLGDTVVAAEMMKYIRDTAYRLSEENVPHGRAERNAYRLGFGRGVSQQVNEILKERQEIKMSDGKALVAVKMSLVEQEFGKAKYGTKRQTTRGSMSNYQRGIEAGKRVSLNQQVKGSSQKSLPGA